MNILLWICQAVLALLYLSGGAYKVFGFDEVAAQFAAVPRVSWTVLGVLEIAGAVLLIAPAALKWLPQLTPTAAAVLTLETVGLAVLYARYSLELSPSNPLVWALVMAAMVGFVAYGRYALAPTA